MNKKLIAVVISVIALTFTLASLSAGNIAASAPSQKAFVGTWERIASKDREGQPITGAAVSSQIIFGADGHYVQVINPPGRAKLDKPIKEMTKEELLNRFEGVSGSYGTYSISGNTLTRKLISTTNPNLDGTEFKQTYKFEGDLLILNSTTTKGEARFRRVK